MTSTASQRLRLDKQATGDNPDAWGDRLNGVIDLVDEAFGFAEIAVNGNVTLTAQNFVSDQARRGVLRFTGSGGFNVVIPAVEKMYLIDNRCTGSVTIKTASTPGAVLGSGQFRFVYCDGATVNAPSPTGTTALATPFTPSGGLVATNVQDALIELDAEKARLDGATFIGNIISAFASDVIFTLEDLSAPANTFRSKNIYSSKNVGGGNDWLFRQRRPSDGATEDFTLKSGQSGVIWTTGNFNPADYQGKIVVETTTGARRININGTYIISGTAIVTTTNGGEIFIAFPWAFPANCISVLVANADTNVTYGSQSVFGTRSRNAQGFTLTVEDRTGPRANATVRVDYYATGN